VTTRKYQERLDTLANVRNAGINVCCGGIVGMGETRKDRAGLLHTLATLPSHPRSLPINALVPIPGTPLGEAPPLDGLEFVRTIAVARLVCPRSIIRLSAGRQGMSREMQALCFLAGANSIFIGVSFSLPLFLDRTRTYSCSRTWVCVRWLWTQVPNTPSLRYS
jgi:biotin synthase